MLDGWLLRDQIMKVIRIASSFFLIEFLLNIVNKISIFLKISLSKRRLPRSPRPHATDRRLPEDEIDESSLQLKLETNP